MVAYLAALGPEPPRPDLSPIVYALETAEAHLAELAEDYYDKRSITKAQFRKASDALTARIGTLRAQAAVMERGTVARRVAGDPLSLARRWEAMTVDEKRAILFAYIESVEVGPGVKGRNTFDPDRVKVEWS